MIYVSPDYRAKTSWMGPKAEADVVQIIRDLKKRHRIGRVFITGGSMGGTAALTFAALHPDLVAGVASLVKKGSTGRPVTLDSWPDVPRKPAPSAP